MRKSGDFSYHILFGSQDKRLSEEAYRHWAQIVERRYDFYREKRCAFPSVTFSASSLFESCVPLSLLHCREFHVPQTHLSMSPYAFPRAFVIPPAERLPFSARSPKKTCCLSGIPTSPRPLPPPGESWRCTSIPPSMPATHAVLMCRRRGEA